MYDIHMHEIPRWNTLEKSLYTSKNEGQEGKTDSVQRWVPAGEGG
jgi:hypothetical protein